MNSLDKKYTVLLLSAPIGSGHRLAAQALEQRFCQQKNVQVLHGNVFDFFPHCLGSAFLRSYLWILGRCPWLYALAYKWGNQQGGSLWLRGLLNRSLAFLGSNYLNRVKPDAVIATHATPTGIMSYYKQKHPDIFLGAVVTDFTIHQWWQCQGVDAYFLADERLCKRIKVPAQVHAFGIPVRQQFLDNDRAECRSRYGWEQNQQVCLLMGGGEGLLPMAEILNGLQAAKIHNLHVVAITGHNQQLAEKLRNEFILQGKSQSTNGANCSDFDDDKQGFIGTDAVALDIPEIYGFREDVPQLMEGADMIITKAGGLTSAEVLASGLELIIYKPLPGQEQNNAAFLRDYYHVPIVNDIPSLIEAVKSKCVAGTNKAQAVEERKAALGRPLAAEQICACVLEKLTSRQ